MCTKAAFEASGRSEGSVICDKPVVKISDSILKNENAESGESSAKFFMQRFHAIFIGTFLCN